MDKSEKLSFSFIRGSSDPRLATCRGKLQNKRCKLNQEINKELRLRSGAENLYKATTNKKMKDTVALELSFVNSNLQLLKKQLAELNSSVEIYQNDKSGSGFPMIPLGLKETKEISFHEQFSDFILEHYSENPSSYEDAIVDLSDTRQAARTPNRDDSGVSLLFRYYNLLYYVERRFFPVDRNIGIYFEWYDSLTGVPSCQRTVAFEKACILFNLGAIFTQIGSKQDRTSENELDLAVENFLKAAGIFKHIFDTFTNAPSMDLKPFVLEVFVSLMLAQARECLFEKLQLQLKDLPTNETEQTYLELSGEALQLSTEFNRIHINIQSNNTHTYLPECWSGLVPLKNQYYCTLAHFYFAMSINLVKESTKAAKKLERQESFIHKNNKSQMILEEEEVKPICQKKIHLREALSCHEETLRLQRMCRELRSKNKISQILRQLEIKINDEMDDLDTSELIDNDDLELMDVTLNVKSKFTLTLTGPDFTAFKTEDPFKNLGPIAIFSARRNWSAPRTVRLHKTSNYYQNNNNYSSRRSRYADDNEEEFYEGQEKNHNVAEFGFRLKGDMPVMFSNVEINSLADLGGIKEGDFIVEINSIDAKWMTQKQAIDLIKKSGNSLDLKVITPMTKSYIKQNPLVGSYATLSDSGISSENSSPMSTTKPVNPSSKSKARMKLNKAKFSSLSSNWNPFKRTNSLGKIF